MLSISETELIEELIVALLASPQLALFFEKFPRLKQAMMGELPRWRAEIAAQMKTTPVPDALAREFQLFQQMQLLSSHAFSEQLPAIMTQLKALPSPFIEEGQQTAAAYRQRPAEQCAAHAVPAALAPEPDAANPDAERNPAGRAAGTPDG